MKNVPKQIKQIKGYNGRKLDIYD